MTINKSQGQALKQIRLYWHDDVFTHGQLHVALSRVTSYAGIKILVKKKGASVDNESESYTKNIIYAEIFNEIS